MKKPIGGPSWGNMPYQARRPSGAFSVAISAAPPHSPPSPTPCRKRNAASSQGASTPAVAYPGSAPIRVVARPIISMVATSADLRPTRSPKCPNRNDADGPREKGDAEGEIGVERLRLAARTWGRTSARTPARRRCRKCRSRRIRSSCRRGSRAGSCPCPRAPRLPPPLPGSPPSSLLSSASRIQI